ncbi:hypothetical protein KJ567_06390 [Candidatus Bipolaricaulota bacterium]|nr:hypothetical protein [Candidatus Bipolaricaulota bacterium]
MANRSFLDNLVPDDAIQTYSALLLFCGIAMLFAIPFAARVSQHTMFQSFYAPSVFFVVYTFLMSVVGIGRGSAVAAQERGLRAALMIGLHVLLGQLLVLPYLIYVRAVLAASEPRIAVIALYSLLVAFFVGLVGHAVESRAIMRRRPALLLKTALVLSYYVAPFGLNLAVRDRAALVSLISPFGAVLHILNRGSALATTVAFAIPAAMIAMLLVRMRHQARRGPA